MKVAAREKFSKVLDMDATSISLKNLMWSLLVVPSGLPSGAAGLCPEARFLAASSVLFLWYLVDASLDA